MKRKINLSVEEVIRALGINKSWPDDNHEGNDSRIAAAIHDTVGAGGRL